MKNIGIIGAGVSGLHLGIRLVQAGVKSTIYTPATAEDIAGSRMLNSVSHQFDTVLREREMGIEFWDEENCRVSRGHHHFINTHDGNPLFFWGNFDGYGKAIDYRMYLPRLMQAFEEQGGILDYRETSADDLESLAEQHDLLAIGVGKRNDGFAELFPKIDTLSLHSEPQRLLCCGLYKGIEDASPCGVTISISVGHGELIEIPIKSMEGDVTVLLLENRPDGELAELMKLSYDDDEDGFNNTILAALEKHHCSTFDRVDKNSFGLTRKLDLLQGALTPIIRSCYAPIKGDTCAVAIGDLRVTMDPVNGQGANLASYGACKLADHIIAAGESDLDDAFCREYEEATAHRVEGTVNFNNAILNPQPQLLKLLHCMSGNREICSDFTARFARPETVWWDILINEEQTDSYISSFN